LPSEPDRKEWLAWRAILDNCLLAQSFCAMLSVDEFAADRKTFYAVTRCLEIVSEASRRLRGAQQADHPWIRWRQIEDSGNVFRHVYQNVAESRVWAIVHGELNDLIAAANTVLGEEPVREHHPK
jgi:uncharacterized protein with HEPN domain